MGTGCSSDAQAHSVAAVAARPSRAKTSPLPGKLAERPSAACNNDMIPAVRGDSASAVDRRQSTRDSAYLTIERSGASARAALAAHASGDAADGRAAAVRGPHARALSGRSTATTAKPSPLDSLSSRHGAAAAAAAHAAARLSRRTLPAEVFVPRGGKGGRSGRSGASMPFVIRQTDAIGDSYAFGAMLGKGQFGVVHRATEKATGKAYAVKSISKRKAKTHAHFSKNVKHEVEIMFHLVGHPNVLELKEVYEDDHAVHLVMELCEGGDWFHRLVSGGTYTEDMAADTVRTMLKAIAYCHSLGVVHRDIKPENMIYVDRSEGSEVKLCDFGLSAMLPATAMAPQAEFHRAESGVDLLNDPVGTPYYVAPEVINGQGYGRECDVWSLGVVTFISLGGSPPFNGKNQADVFYNIKYRPLSFSEASWEDISHEAKDFIRRMMEKDPAQRATVPELLQHPWLAHNAAASHEPGEAAHSMQAPACPLRRGQVPDAVVQRLQAFSALNRFNKEARRVLASLLPPEEVVGLLNIFKEMDADGNGVLTFKEMQGALTKKGVKFAKEEARLMLACADINADGVIDYQEFLAATVHEQRLDKDELLFKAFQEFDVDGSGFIGREEMATALAKHGGPKVNIDALLQEIDADCDGRINYDEFCTAFRHHDDEASGLVSLLPTPGMPQAAPLKADTGRASRTPAADAGLATGGVA